jgi:hypothetical protein
VTYGFNLVYTLKGVDDPAPTFHKSGFYDNHVIRQSVLGAPVPAEYSLGSTAPLDYIEDNLQLVGAFGPHLGDVTADLDTKRVYLSSGATDIIVHENCGTYEKLAWRAPTLEEIDRAKKSGSLHERRNPGAPRVVPMNKQFITGPISEVARTIFRHMNAADWNLLLNGKVKEAVDVAREKSDQIVLPDGSMKIALRHGSTRQLTVMFKMIHDCMILSEEIKHFRAIQAGTVAATGSKEPHLQDVTTAPDMTRILTERVAEIAGGMSNYHQQRQSKFVGTSLSKGQGGFTSHVHLGR